MVFFIYLFFTRSFFAAVNLNNGALTERRVIIGDGIYHTRQRDSRIDLCFIFGNVARAIDERDQINSFLGLIIIYYSEYQRLSPSIDSLLYRIDKASLS